MEDETNQQPIVDFVGETIRGYTFRERVGRGGYGAVYRAHQASVDRDVAVKVILPEYADQPEFHREFMVEAQLVARLEHLHIIPLYDFWQDSNGAFIVMRLLRGGSLRRRLEKSPLTTNDVVRLLDQLTAALHVAHSAGIVHRDIKPENILLDERENAYLTDFGIAKPVGHVYTGDQISGSIAYMPPEQLMGEPPTPASDVYALGFVAYEMLTGRYPFDGSVTEIILKHMNEPVPPLPPAQGSLTTAINAVIQQMTAKEVSDRYPDMPSVATAFREAVGTAATIDYEPGTVALDDAQQEALRQLIAQQVGQLEGDLFALYDQLSVQASDDPAALRREIERIRTIKTYRSTGLERIRATLPPEIPNHLKPSPAEADEITDLHGVFDRVREAVLDGESVLLLGPTGAGKSVIANAVGRDDAVQEHFSGRVIRLAFGAEPDLLALLGDALLIFDAGVSLADLTTIEARADRLRTAIGDALTLILVDDLHDVAHLQAVVPDGVVFIGTTRFVAVTTDLPARVVDVDSLTPEQRVMLLARLLPDMDVSKVEAAVADFVAQVGGLPRDLALASRSLRRSRGNMTRLRREMERLSQGLEGALEPAYTLFQESLRMLDTDTQQTLSNLAILPPEPNTFDDNAAEAVAQSIDALYDLVDSALLKNLTDQDDRYALYPSFRAFAQRHQPPEAEAYQRTVTYFVDYAQQSRDNTEALEIERDNLDAALRIAIEQAYTAQLIRGVLVLFPFWQAQGLIDRAMYFVSEALRLAQTDSTVDAGDVAWLHYNISQLHDVAGQLDESESHTEQGLALLADLPPGQETTAIHSRLLIHRARLDYYRQEYAAAESTLNEVLALLDGTSHHTERSEAYNVLAGAVIKAHQDYARARDIYSESLTAARRSGDNGRINFALTNLIIVEMMLSDNLDRAMAYSRENIELARMMGHQAHLSNALHRRGQLELAERNPEAARAYFEEAIETAKRAQLRQRIGSSLIWLALSLTQLRLLDEAESCIHEGLDYIVQREDAVGVQDAVDYLFQVGAARLIHNQPRYDASVWRDVTNAAVQFDIPTHARERLEQMQAYLDTNVTGNSSTEAVIWAHLASGRLERDEFYEPRLAQEYFAAALSLALDVKDDTSIAESGLELARTYHQLGDYASAETILAQVAQQTPNTDTLGQLLDALAMVGESRQANHQLDDLDAGAWAQVIAAANHESLTEQRTRVEALLEALET